MVTGYGKSTRNSVVTQYIIIYYIHDPSCVRLDKLTADATGGCIWCSEQKGWVDGRICVRERALSCVCVWEGVDRKRKGCCSTVFTRVPAGRLCVRRRLFFPRPPIAHNRKLLVNLPFMSREMQFGSSPRIYPSLVSVSGLSPRALKPPLPTQTDPRPAPGVVNSSASHEFNVRV